MRCSICIRTIIIRAMGKLNTHSPIYCMKHNWENILNLRHTLVGMCLTNSLEVQYLQIRHHEDNEEMYYADKRIWPSHYTIWYNILSFRISACPINTYDSGTGICESCPANAGTATEASTSLQQCVCNDGFTGVPGGECLGGYMPWLP